MRYHAFLCYNSKNYHEVETIFEYLSNSHLKIFLDKKILLPGSKHDIEIDKAIRNSDAFVVFIGKQGLGPWQKEEILSSHWESVISSAMNLIPVILPGASLKHDEVPGFLRSRTAVEFNKSVDDADSLQRLQDGILSLSESTMNNDNSKPFTQHEFDSLLKSTILAYDNPTMADKFYETWQKEIPIHKLELFLRHLSKGATILDAGCGPGHHSNLLAKKGYNVTGIDLSHSSLKIAKKTKNKLSKVDFLNMDMRETKFKRNSFDGIWACGSCVHTPDDFLDRQLREYLRILKPGGVLGITLQVGRLSAKESDGRYFEGYLDQSEIMDYLELPKFAVLDISSDVTKKTTNGIKKVSNWVAFIAKAPTKRHFINSEHNMKKESRGGYK